MKKIVIMLGCIFLLSFCQESKKAVLLNPSEFKAAISEKKVQLIDVRTAAEYAQNRIEYAINIDVLQPDSFKKDIENLDKDQPVYVYCRSGRRSQTAAKFLFAQGFKKVYDLDGGILAWK